jgi:hexosaminidase
LAQKGAGGAVVMVNVMNPCWIYHGLDLGAVRGFDLAVTSMPFNFQIGQDIKKIPLYPHAARGGQLEIRLDGCAGDKLAVLTLPVRRGRLHAAIAPHAGVHDICFVFARRKVDPVWALEWVQPLRGD